MIAIFPPFPLHSSDRILIPIIKIFLSFILLASFLSLFIISPISCSSLPITNHQRNQETMKVHPLPKKRNNIVAIQFYNQRGDPLLLPSGGSYNKKLRRLPHIFSRVLELPFRSDAEVSIEENPDCFRFVAETDNHVGEVRAHTIEIHPGVTKIVIRPNGFLGLSSLDDLELDMWRFRLPETTRPELASAVLADGELIVTVPKGEELGEEGSGNNNNNNNNNGEFRGGMGNNSNNNNAMLVLVQ